MNLYSTYLKIIREHYFQATKGNKNKRCFGQSKNHKKERKQRSTEQVRQVKNTKQCFILKTRYILSSCGLMCFLNTNRKQKNLSGMNEK